MHLQAPLHQQQIQVTVMRGLVLHSSQMQRQQELWNPPVLRLVRSVALQGTQHQRH